MTYAVAGMVTTREFIVMPARHPGLPDALLRLPGVRLERAPDMTWCDGLMSYELRGAVVTCSRA
jgi:hypothetical protein